jgi:hypothetical protein
VWLGFLHGLLQSIKCQGIIATTLIEAWLGFLSSLPWVEKLMHVASFKDWYKFPSLGIGIFMGETLDANE